MTYSYQIFGMSITSEISMPAIQTLHTRLKTPPDINIIFGDTPADLPNPLFKGVRFQADKGEFLLRVDKIARYHVQNGNRITITPETGTNDQDILPFLMGSAMGALLHQRNILALHAGAIEVNGGSVIFTGPSGVGKSTLTAGFHQRGYKFLADDVCAVTLHNGSPAVLPGFPRLKLWCDSLKKLNTSNRGLESVRWSGNLEKYFLPVKNIQPKPVPVHSVFILETTNTEKMDVTFFNGGEKIGPILDNTYRLRFLKGLGGKTNHFTQCAAVAAKATVCRAVRPISKFLLDELMDMLESRFLS